MSARAIHPRPRGARVHPRLRGTQEREPAYAALGLVFDPSSSSRDTRTRTGTRLDTRGAWFGFLIRPLLRGTQDPEPAHGPTHTALGLVSDPSASLEDTRTRKPETYVRRTCPPLTEISKRVRPFDKTQCNLSPAGGGESAVADLGVEFCRLDFGVWLAANSISSQRVGYPDGQTQGSAPTFRIATASGLSRSVLVAAVWEEGDRGDRA